MGVKKEVWVEAIQERMFPDNSFVILSTDHSAYISYNKVHVPLAGLVGAISENRDNSTDGTAVLREDTDLEYPIIDFTTPVVKIPLVEEIETSYNKLASVSKAFADILSLGAHNRIAYNWMPTDAANIIRTTGSAVAASVPTATGNRKAITLEDLTLAVSMLDEDSAGEQRGMLINPKQWRILVAEMMEKSALNVTTSDSLFAQNKLMDLFGLKIFKRPTKYMPFYDNATTPVPQKVGTTSTAGNAACLIWSAAQVSRAIGTVNFIEQTNDTRAFGASYSASARAGGAIIGNNCKPVAIVEAASA